MRVTRQWYLVNSAVARNFMKFFLSPLSQSVTSTNPNLFGPAVSEHSLWSLKETDGSEPSG